MYKTHQLILFITKVKVKYPNQIHN